MSETAGERLALNHLQAVVFDWAGTLVDHGSLAPVAVFADVFNDLGIKLTCEQIRSAMGLSKRRHIGAILDIPEVSESWMRLHGERPGERTVDRLYAAFLDQQESVIVERANLLAGVPELVYQLRNACIRIGTTTGYPKEAAGALLKEVKKAGFEPDCLLCDSDVEEGRPAPWMIFRACEQMGVYPLSRVVNVDDTTSGVRAGCNAGCWSVGVTLTGNQVGLSEVELRDLDEREKEAVHQEAGKALSEAGALYVIRSVADLPAVLREIDQRIAAEESPLSRTSMASSS
jgi:phosphonoacetaldehyde hydrolase